MHTHFKIMRFFKMQTHSEYETEHQFVFSCTCHMDSCNLVKNISYPATRAPSQYPKRRLFVRSRKVSKPRDWYFKLSYRFEIWQAHRHNSKYKSRGFETLRDLTERRLFGYWDGAQVASGCRCRRHLGVRYDILINIFFNRWRFMASCHWASTICLFEVDVDSWTCQT